MISDFYQPGRASFIVGGQFGSEGKGAAAAWIAHYLKEAGLTFPIVTTNAGAQAGHTSIHNGQTRVAFHLPTAPLINRASMAYLNAGSIIDPERFNKEWLDLMPQGRLVVHPNAAVITPECIEAEMREDSAQTKTGSTRKGVGEALARKVLRSGKIMRNMSGFGRMVRSIDLNGEMNMRGAAVLVEVPQGIGLSLNSAFYPHTTSRDCTVAQATSDAGIHPHFVGPTMLVLRTFPIRVGNIEKEVNQEQLAFTDARPARGDVLSMTIGHSGGCHLDQEETTWEELGLAPEITTVTKRVRRVFHWSKLQVDLAIASARPSIVFLTHCDYVEKLGKPIWPYIASIDRAAIRAGVKPPDVVCSYGPSTIDARLWEGQRG